VILVNSVIAGAMVVIALVALDIASQLRVVRGLLEGQGGSSAGARLRSALGGGWAGAGELSHPGHPAPVPPGYPSKFLWAEAGGAGRPGGVPATYPSTFLQETRAGFCVWSYRDGAWSLELDRCGEGYAPGPPPPFNGEYEGQCVRTPGVLLVA
jgi:hypothetical protein